MCVVIYRLWESDQSLYTVWQLQKCSGYTYKTGTYVLYYCFVV